MSYGGAPYPTRYGGTVSMPMPNIPGNENSFNTAYPASSVSGYPKGAVPYPVSTSTQNASYPGTSPRFQSAVELDDSMKKLTDDLINSVIKVARNEDLQGLIDSEEKLMELINDSPITKELNNKRLEMTDFNKDQAAANLSLKPEFELLQTTLQELSQKQNELRDRYFDLQSKCGNSLSSDTLLSLLQVAAGEQETKSEDIRYSFYDGELPVDDFLKQFVEGRKLFQLRKIKSEKLKSMLQNPIQVGGGSRPPVPGRPGVSGYMAHQPSTYGAQYQPPYPR